MVSVLDVHTFFPSFLVLLRFTSFPTSTCQPLALVYYLLHKVNNPFPLPLQGKQIIPTSQVSCCDSKQTQDTPQMQSMTTWKESLTIQSMTAWNESLVVQSMPLQQFTIQLVAIFQQSTQPHIFSTDNLMRHTGRSSTIMTIRKLQIFYRSF